MQAMYKATALCINLKQMPSMHSNTSKLITTGT
jgi:hypothetical protein